MQSPHLENSSLRNSVLQMFGQTFSVSDIPKVLILAFLEILLSMDNAIILGLIASKLPQRLRSRALFTGFVSAWVLRIIAILGLSYFLQYLWIQVFGGLYLIYLAVKYFFKKKDHSGLLPKPKVNFWTAVLMIELFDLAFAMDSIVSGLAFIAGPGEPVLFHPKIWIVYLGGMIGVFFIRYTSQIFSTFLIRFPRLETAAYMMIGWIGLKLICTALAFTFPYFDLVFWTGLVLFFLLGFLYE